MTDSKGAPFNSIPNFKLSQEMLGITPTLKAIKIQNQANSTTYSVYETILFGLVDNLQSKLKHSPTCPPGKYTLNPYYNPWTNEINK